MTPLKANCWGGKCFGYVCTCIQGIRRFWRRGKITVSSGYTLYTWLYCTEKKSSQDAETADLFQEV